MRTRTLPLKPDILDAIRHGAGTSCEIFDRLVRGARPDARENTLVLALCRYFRSGELVRTRDRYGRFVYALPDATSQRQAGDVAATPCDGAEGGVR